MEKKYASVNGLSMAYIEAGEGDPIVFLHGNPTSSYLWRFVWPHVKGQGRVIVPDLIGMGDSEKLPESGPESYTFVEHREYLWALLEQLGVTERVSLVIHDWGSALGFDWAYQHQGAVKALMYMEAIVGPIASWEDWPEKPRPIFQAMRSEAGEELVLQKNIFVERILPASIIRTLDEDEMAEYRRPFLEPGEARRPTLTWPRQIPIEGDPADVTEIVSAYSTWLAQSNLPKFFVNADPGTILTGRARDFCRTWPNQREMTVPGIHFIQEDAGAIIGASLSDWLNHLQ
jgi:haloalkane dehalogenase